MAAAMGGLAALPLRALLPIHDTGFDSVFEPRAEDAQWRGAVLSYRIDQAVVLFLGEGCFERDDSCPDGGVAVTRGAARHLASRLLRAMRLSEV